MSYLPYIMAYGSVSFVILQSVSAVIFSWPYDATIAVCINTGMAVLGVPVGVWCGRHWRG